ncbi:NAD-dependent epimerase/dehydratase family protein [Spirosoma fluminis]
MMKPTVLLTGASGFSGAHPTRELSAREYRVRALIRNGRSCSTLADLSVEYYAGDVLDTKSLKKAVVGCDASIHAAALAQINPARRSVVRAVNPAGTENLIEVVKRGNIQRFVYIGTTCLFGFGTKTNSLMECILSSENNTDPIILIVNERLQSGGQTPVGAAIDEAVNGLKRYNYTTQRGRTH